MSCKEREDRDMAIALADSREAKHMDAASVFKVAVSPAQRLVPRAV